ncbi:hypothetical protein BH23ACT2_BH23ACT2_10580 [soil metagenome]
MSPEPDDAPLRPDDIAQSSGLSDDLAPTGGDQVADDPLTALLGSDGGIGLGSLMEQASQMQAQLLAAQQEAASAMVEGVAGGGAVRISVTGAYQFESVAIDPAAVDPNDVDMLQDLVLAALRHAAEQVDELQSGSVDLGGLGLGDLFGN